MSTLYRKYRPVVWADVVGQEHVKVTLSQEIASGSIAHAYLFSGPRGVGKTTAARIFARGVNCSAKSDARKGEACGECSSCAMILDGRAIDIVEIDAASHRGIEMVRETIVEGSRFAPVALKYKVFIIDEVHMLSNDAWNALLKTLEEPPAHAVFVLATTEMHKVPATVISRCERYEFRRIADDLIRDRLVSVISKEGREVAPEVVSAIVRLADGGLRDAESLLGQVLSAAGDAVVTVEVAEMVLPIVGSAHARELSEALLAHDAARGFAAVSAARLAGGDALRLMDEATMLLRERMLGAAKGDAVVGECARLISRLVEARQSARFLQQAFLAVEMVVGAAACSVAPAVGTTKPDRLSFATPVGLAVPTAVAPTVQVASMPPAPASPVPVSPVSPIAVATPVVQTVTYDVKPVVGVEVGVGGVQASVEPVVVQQPVVVAPAPVQQVVARVQVDPGAPPVVTLAQVAAKWSEFCVKAGTLQATLSFVLGVAKPIGVVGNVVRLGFTFPYHKDKCNEERNRQPLERVLTAVFGIPLQIEGVLLEKTQEVVHTGSTDPFEAAMAASTPAAGPMAADALADAFGGKMM